MVLFLAISLSIFIQISQFWKESYLTIITYKKHVGVDKVWNQLKDYCDASRWHCCKQHAVAHCARRTVVMLTREIGPDLIGYVGYVYVKQLSGVG